jgi:hypothetical protein
MALERKAGGAGEKMVTGGGESDEPDGLESALHFAGMLRHRVRYFTDGAVIGSKTFVNEAFAASRERFTEKRKNGARRMRGNGKAAAGVLWSLRDLRVRL